MKLTSAVAVLAAGAFAGKVDFDFAQSKPLYDAAKSSLKGLTHEQMSAIPSMVRAGALKALGVKPQQQRRMLMGDCDACTADFKAAGGCELMTAGQDTSSAFDAQTCGICAMGFLEACIPTDLDCTKCVSDYKANPGCAALKTGSMPPQECASCTMQIGMACAADLTGDVVNCAKCASDFKAAGGCDIQGDPSSMIPAGCQSCGAEAQAICSGGGALPIPTDGLECAACGFEAIMNPAEVCAPNATLPQGCDAKCAETWCVVIEEVEGDGWPSADDFAKVTDQPCRDAMVALGEFFMADNAKCQPGENMQSWCDGCSADAKPLVDAALAACTAEKLAVLGEFGQGFMCNAELIDSMCIVENGVVCMSALEMMEDMPNATVLETVCPCVAKLGDVVPKMMKCESEDSAASFEVMTTMMCEKTNGNYCFPATMELFSGMETMFNPLAEKPPKKTVAQLDHMCACTHDMDEKLKALMQMMNGAASSGEDTADSEEIQKLLDALRPMMRLECIKDDENNYCALQEGFDSTMATVEAVMGGMFGGGEGSAEADPVWKDLCTPCFKRVLGPVMDATGAIMEMVMGALSGMGMDPSVLTPEQQAEEEKAAEQAKQMMQMMMDVSKRMFSASCLKQESGEGFCGDVAGKLEENNGALTLPLLTCEIGKTTCNSTCSTGLEAVKTALGSCAGPLLEVTLLSYRMSMLAVQGETGVVGNVTTGNESPADPAKILSEIEALREYAADVCKVPVFKKFGETKDFDFTLTNLKDDYVNENLDDLIQEIKNDAAGSLGIAIDSIKDVVLVIGSDGTVKVTVTIEAADPQDQTTLESSDGSGLGGIVVNVPDDAKVNPDVDIGAAMPTPAPEPTPDAEKVSSAGRATATLVVAAALVAAVM